MKRISDFKLYLNLESTNLFRYFIENNIFIFFSWIPGFIGILLRNLIYRPIINLKGIVNIEESVIFKRPDNIFLGKEVFIDHNVYIHGSPGGVFIGDYSAIMHNTEIHPYQYYIPLGPDESVGWEVIENSKIKIGKNTLIGAFSIINGQGGVLIGDNVLIGPRVTIVPINHKYLNTTVLIKNQGYEAKGIYIDDNVWIGAGAIILDGVKIGKGSVIGAGSIVTKEIPPYSLAFGNPARIQKRLRKRKVD